METKEHNNHSPESEEFARSFGFECTGTIVTSKLQVRPEVRDMCAADLCKSFDKNWMCPPACGDVSSFAEQIAQKERVVVVQTVAELEDEFDFEGIVEASKVHEDRFQEYAAAVKAACQSASLACEPLFLSAGACTVCPECTYPDDPCRNPELAFTSMEAAGLVVSSVCDAAEIPYYHGKGTLAFCSCALF